MAYCTLSDLKEKISEDELVELTDDENTGSIVISRTDRAIADAGSVIDGYCAERYGVPLDPVPPVIRKFCVDIAIYNLLQRREGASEERERDYKSAIQFLKDVSKGVVTLGVHPQPDPPDDKNIAGGSLVSTRDKVFGVETMDKY
jgi:phage gp36-like protein